MKRLIIVASVIAGLASAPSWAPNGGGVIRGFGLPLPGSGWPTGGGVIYPVPDPNGGGVIRGSGAKKVATKKA
jgi:hypothetical protein